MRMLVAHSLAPLVVALVLVAAGPSQAQVVDLSDPSAFSGSEIMLDFEDPSFFDGMAVAQFGDVTLGLEDAAGGDFGGASFGLAVEPREFGSASAGSLNNFGTPGLPFPFPMIRLGFPGVMHRVSFEVRASEQDEVVVTFRRGGAVVGQATRPSPTAGTFHFHGFEVLDGFDEVLVDATENFTGALALDNLAYEALSVEPPQEPEPPAEDPDDPEEPGEVPDTEEPADDVPVLACDGFYPAGARLHKLGHGRAGKLARYLLGHLPFKLLRARLADEHGVAVAWQDLLAAPVVQVVHTPLGSDESKDISDLAVLYGNREFRYGDKGRWRKLLRRSALREPGTYVLTMESGDMTEYALESCVEWIVVEPPPERRGRHSWIGRWRSKFGGRH